MVVTKMLIRITNTFLFMVFTSTVANVLEENSNQKNSESYKYNHPPSFEPYNVPTPSQFEERKIRETQYSENVNNKMIVGVEPINKVDYLLESEYSEVSNVNDKVNRLEQIRNEQSLQEIKIGVAQITQDLEGQRKMVTEKPISTSPSPRTVVPKMFTKRPVVYNPLNKQIVDRNPVVKIVKEQNFVYSHTGNFHYSYEGADGTKVSSVGQLRSSKNDKAGEAVTGEIHYKDNEGNDYNLSYTADENGYRPHGAHLPTPPPIPPAIARALKYLTTQTRTESATKPNN